MVCQDELFGCIESTPFDFFWWIFAIISLCFTIWAVKEVLKFYKEK